MNIIRAVFQSFPALKNATNAKGMVMVTDGDANVVAPAAKAAGVTIYSIGLPGNGGIDETALREWSAQPMQDD